MKLAHLYSDAGNFVAVVAVLRPTFPPVIVLEGLAYFPHADDGETGLYHRGDALIDPMKISAISLEQLQGASDPGPARVARPRRRPAVGRTA